jgi:PncC family amidohydrolase
MTTEAEQVGQALQDRGLTLAVAESLTGGLLASSFARASGASSWFQGGIVAYASSVKYDLLKVPRGPVVSEQAAGAAAAGRLSGKHLRAGLPAGECHPGRAAHGADGAPRRR